MNTYNIRICQDCAECVMEGIAIPENPTMGEIGMIVITGEDWEFMRADCGACGTHTTGDFIDAIEYEV